MANILSTSVMVLDDFGKIVSAQQSSINQQAGSIELMVSKDGVISAINQTAEAIKIQANKIDINGIVTANNYFKILADGSMEAINGKFTGKITATSGSIGAWSVNSDSLFTSNGDIYTNIFSSVGIQDYKGKNVLFGVSGFYPDTESAFPLDNFEVTGDGFLYSYPSDYTVAEPDSRYIKIGNGELSLGSCIRMYTSVGSMQQIGSIDFINNTSGVPTIIDADSIRVYELNANRITLTTFSPTLTGANNYICNGFKMGNIAIITFVIFNKNAFNGGVAYELFTVPTGYRPPIQINGTAAAGNGSGPSQGYVLYSGLSTSGSFTVAAGGGVSAGSAIVGQIVYPIA